MIRLVFLIASLLAGNAWAITVSDPVTLGFTCISNNDAGNCLLGEADPLGMKVRVGTAEGGRNGTDIQFRHLMIPSGGARIQEVYIDSPTLENYDLVNDVLFVPSGSAAYQQDEVHPGNLPAGNEVGFFADFAAEPLKQTDCDINKPPCSIDEGQFYTINFGKLAFDTVALALASNDFIIGIHVVGYQNGGSESFVTSLPTVVPVPAAFWLFGTALIGFIGFSRRTRL